MFPMPDNSSTHGFVGRALPPLLIFLAISAAYLYAFPQANIFYAGIVLLHTLAGVFTAILLIRALYPRVRNGSVCARAGWLLIASGSILGLILIKTGTARAEWRWLYLHILLSLIGVGLLIGDKWGQRKSLSSNTTTPNTATRILPVAICLLLLVGIGYG